MERKCNCQDGNNGRFYSLRANHHIPFFNAFQNLKTAAAFNAQLHIYAALGVAVLDDDKVTPGEITNGRWW
jgi:hypothetical protein